MHLGPRLNGKREEERIYKILDTGYDMYKYAVFLRIPDGWKQMSDIYMYESGARNFAKRVGIKLSN